MGGIRDYAEVRTDYFADNFWYVDVWETDDDAEEGRTVAYVHKSGDYVITEPKAHISPKVADAIAGLLENLKEKPVC